MRCDEARALLWPPEEPKVVGSRILEARRHVEACEGCRDYLAMDAALVERFRRAREIQAPPEVRERIFDALARERVADHASPPSRVSGKEQRKGLHSLPAALASVAVVFFVVMFTVSGPFSNLGGDADEPGALVRESGRVFVEDFLRRAVQAEHIQTSDPSEVARFLTRELGTPVGTPLSFPGFDLAGAEVCIVEGARGAVVLYKQGGRILYHYIIPNDTRGETDPAVSDAIPPRWSGERSYPSVVTWRAGGLDQALVSDLPRDELLAVARGITDER